jgi:nucleoside-diphosphate-sugar epimerase
MTKAQFSAPEAPLIPTRTPDKVLVVGATGHVGRLFLEQGLAMYGDAVEFRVLTRSASAARDLPAQVLRMQGDIRDIDSIRRACEGFTRESIIFDSSTYINLAYSDPDGSIMGTNLDGPLHVLTVAREIGCSLQKAHSQAGLAAPREGAITEETPCVPAAEEDVYATLPYLLAKKQVTHALLAARAEGARVMVSYLVTPWGPFSREDALTLDILRTSLRYRRYFYPAGSDLAYVDARDAAKLHWLASPSR